ncbi:hypothetical protein BHE74_00038468 [Ensete ventricosum]|nr:hypothetical protein BHE74_00038468 [Ensete ventricosum]RZR94249.1 hypothetical protein BHM03_00022911 [Ensete ventricosum]
MMRRFALRICIAYGAHLWGELSTILRLMCLGGHAPLQVILACGDWRCDFNGWSEFSYRGSIVNNECRIEARRAQSRRRRRCKAADVEQRLVEARRKLSRMRRRRRATVAWVLGLYLTLLRTRRRCRTTKT